MGPTRPSRPLTSGLRPASLRPARGAGAGTARQRPVSARARRRTGRRRRRGRRRPAGPGAPSPTEARSRFAWRRPTRRSPTSAARFLPDGRGAALLPLHDGRRAHPHQARDRGLAEGEAMAELLDETGRQPRRARLVLGDRGLPSAARVGFLPARRHLAERRDLRAKLPHRLTQPTHVPPKRAPPRSGCACARRARSRPCIAISILANGAPPDSRVRIERRVGLDESTLAAGVGLVKPTRRRGRRPLLADGTR